jgi:hypothetical protein
MKSARNYATVVLGLVALAASSFAWMQYQELIKLRAGLLDPNERADLERRLSDAEKRSHDLQDELTALKGKQAPVDIAGPEDNGPGENRGRRGPGGWGPWQSMASDPKLQKLMAIQQKGMLDSRYAALFKSLNLTPQQLDQFKNLLVEKQQAMLDAMNAAREQGINPRTDPDAFNQAITQAQAAVDAQIQSALGDAGFAQYQQYVQTLPERNTVNQLQQALSYTGTPLTDDQASQMINLLQQTSPPRSGNGTAGTGAPGGIGALLGMGNQTSRVTDETITQAAGILSGPQVQALQQIQTQQQTQQQIQQMMRNANRPPAPPPGG